MSSTSHTSIPTKPMAGDEKLQGSPIEPKPQEESKGPGWWSRQWSHLKAFWSRWANFIRCVLFLVIEGGYIALAGFLLNDTLPLPNPPPLPSFLARFNFSSPSTDTVKSAIGAAFNIWHALSGVFAAGVFSDAFSREWSIPKDKSVSSKHSNTANPSPASDPPPPSSPASNPSPTTPSSAPKDPPLDRVSTLTSGLWDQLLHMKEGSSIFHFTLAASFVLFILVKFGPSTIIFDNRIDEYPIQIGGILLGTSDLSHSVLKVELVLNATVGYATDPYWIIPKPAQDASRSGGGIQYTSDVISFNHSCDWYTPEFTPETVKFGGEEFDFRQRRTSTIPNETTFGSGVFPIRSLNPTKSTSAFLIFGGNSSFPLKTDPLFQNLTNLDLGEQALGNTINLDQLPVSHSASWFNFTSTRFKVNNGHSLVFRAPLATGLLCDARAVLHTRPVNLTSNRLGVMLEDKPIPNPIGNINETDIPRYFSYALDGVGDLQERVMTLAPDIDPNSIQLSLFQTPLLVDFTPLAARLLLPQIPIKEWVNASQTPLSRLEISANMDRFMTSVSKAQNIDGGEGFAFADRLSGGVSDPRGLLAKERTPKQILKSNRNWFWLTVATTAATFVSCLWISLRIEMDSRKYVPFDLGNVWERTFDNLHLCDECDGVYQSGKWKETFPKRKPPTTA